MLRSNVVGVLAPKRSSLPRRQVLRTLNTATFTPAPASDLDHVDVAIVGGGPAGLSLACALSSSNNIRSALRVTLVEGGDLSRVRNWSPRFDQFSNRVSSITNSSRDFLQQIHAWEHVDMSRTAPVEEMHVWDGLTDSRIVFRSSDIPSGRDTDALTEMATLIENSNIQSALLRCLEKHSEVSVVDNVKVESVQSEDSKGRSWPIIHLSDGRRIQARLLVGADGFNSPVRSFANISTYGWSYDTQAIVATLSHAPRIRTEFQNPNTTAYQRFLPTGPIAFLPLSPTTSSLVWSMKPPVAAALLASDPSVVATFVNAAFRLPDISIRYLNKIFLEAHHNNAPLSGQTMLEEVKWREESHSIDPQSAYSSVETEIIGIPPNDTDMLPPLVTSIQSGTIASFPIRFNHAASYISEAGRSVLVGDAAHTVHPLAGQGLNMGLADVQSLAHCIESTVLHGGDIGSYTSLLPYSRDRYFENHKLLSATDKLHKLYGSTWEPVVWARSVGLEVINEITTVKAALMLSAGASSSRIMRHGAPVFNFAAHGAQAVAQGGGVARMFLGVMDNLAKSAAASITKLTKKP